MSSRTSLWRHSRAVAIVAYLFGFTEVHRGQTNVLQLRWPNGPLSRAEKEENEPKMCNEMQSPKSCQPKFYCTCRAVM